MTAPTLRQMLADVLHANIKFLPREQANDVADALLASPELAAIINVAACGTWGTDDEELINRVAELMNDWETSR